MPDPSDTALIVGRIEASEAGVKQAFAAHEERDKERFEATDKALDTQTHELKVAIGEVKNEVETINGDVGEVKEKVMVIEDRAQVIATRRAGWLNVRQGVGLALVGGVLTFLAYLALGLLGIR